MGIGTDPMLADTNGLAYDEQPAHQVTLSRGFYILKTKVAAADYARSGLPGSATDASWSQAAAALTRRPRRTRCGSALRARAPGRWHRGEHACRTRSAPFVAAARISLSAIAE